MTSNRPGEADRRRLSAKIAAGLILGIAFGLFMGERATILEVIADGYIKLLQMMVLPYVTVSIIGGLGALNGPQGLALVKRVGLVLVVLWVAALAMVFLFPLMFPPHETASFFSASLIRDRESFDFLSLYIPTNPFNSLANNIVPAVVLFSVVIGTALINIPDKARLLDVLAVVSSAVMKATHFIIALTPYGVFAIAAVVAGTLSVAEFERLQVYLISYVGMSLLISFWLLPGLVAALTPVPYGALVARTRNALAMAFMTTSLLAVLPMLTEEARALVQEYGGLDDHQASATDVVVPVSFNFPHTGKLLSLSFLLFAGWFADARVPFWNYPKLAGAGLLSLFGNVNAAIPFMLDLLRIPADTFRLFVTSGIINARFGTLVAAVHTLTIAVLGTCAVTRTLTFDARKILRFAIITCVATAALVGSTRVLLQTALHTRYDKDVLLSGMGMLRDRGPARVYTTAGEAPPLPAARGSLLDRVRSRGALRVGYFDDSLPYVFVNTHGALVGFDVEMALQLARDLHVAAELVRVDRAVLESGIDPALCDVVMSGVAITADRAGGTQFTTTYLDETLALIVPDHRAADFGEWPQIREMGPVRLGVPAVTTLVERVREQLPEAVLVPVNGMDDIFAPRNPPLDAAIATAERGSAYTILHPAYAVAVPKPRPFKVPLAYAVAGRDASLTTMINTWIELQRKNGTVDELFSYWILGENALPQQPRWSVIRDILHWVR